MTDTAPSGALTWCSAAERNRLLKLWRHAVFAIFGERPRCIRLAWVLTDLFNVKSGYAFPTNDYLAEQTNLWISHLGEALLILESGGAIVRANVTNAATGQTQRVIYPATAIIPRPALGQGGGAPSRGRGGEPQQPGHQNLRRIPRIQSSQIALAKADSTRRDERKRHGAGGPVSAPELAEPRAAPQEGYPSSEATRDRPPLPSTKQETQEVGNEAAAGDRAGDGGGGIAPDDAGDSAHRVRTIEEGDEEVEWTLLRRAQEAGLRIERMGDKLLIRGPKRAEPVVKLLGEHKAEVLAVLARGVSTSDRGGQEKAADGTEARRWRDRLATRIADWLRGDRDWEAAKRLA